MRWWRVAAFVAAGVAGLAAAALFVWPGHLFQGSPGASAPVGFAAYNAGYSPGTAIPASAAADCRDLMSDSIAAQRSALTPLLAASLPSASLFPPGSTLRLEPDSWHQAGSFANAFATLTAPGQQPRAVQIGFARQRSGSWQVDFAQSAS